jgi:hypothetical protein
MRPVAFGEVLPVGTRLTLFSDDKPDRFFTVIKFWLDENNSHSPGGRICKSVCFCFDHCTILSIIQ